MQDDGAVEAAECLRGLLVGRTAVDHDGLLQLARELELTVEEGELRLVLCVVPEEVQARLAQRNRAVVAEELARMEERASERDEDEAA